MTTQIVSQKGKKIALIHSQEAVVTDLSSALDLLMSVRYDTGCSSIALEKTVLCEEFFILSTCLAGEILQKFINYHTKLAIFGDFSGYTSKPLRDFIYESNQGKDIFFVSTQEEAIEKLSVV